MANANSHAAELQAHLDVLAGEPEKSERAMKALPESLSSTGTRGRRPNR
jgi:hypothetical protein